MRRYLTFFVILCLEALFTRSCAIYRKEMLCDGGMEAMFFNAIVDFTHSEPGLLKKDAFFQVFAADSQRVCIIGDPNKIPLIVEIPDMTNMSEVMNKNKFILTDTVQNKIALVVDWSCSEDRPSIWFDESLVPKSYRAFPDGIFVYKDKLFFWRNTSHAPANDDVINTLYRYNYVDTLVDKVFWPSYKIDDGKKGVVYYFSNDDLSKYTKSRSPHFH